MTSFADSLKGEIARVARKMLKTDLQALRKTVRTQRSEIAALKVQLKDLSAQTRSLQRQGAASKATPASSETPPATGPGRRAAFGPATLAAYRAKLGISQSQMAVLLGASTLSVHKWESGKAQPRQAQLQKIAQVLKLGKRAALAKLNS